MTSQRTSSPEWKLLIVGEPRVGKDEAAQHLQDTYGLTFKSSSQACLEIFLYDKLKNDYDLGYAEIEAHYGREHAMKYAFEDRVNGNNRQYWFDEICAYNRNDPTRLASEIMYIQNNNIYVGLRSRTELLACLEAGIFDYVIWIDASKRVPKNPKAPLNFGQELTHLVVDNNGTLMQFKYNLDRLAHFLGLRPIWFDSHDTIVLDKNFNFSGV